MLFFQITRISDLGVDHGGSGNAFPECKKKKKKKELT